MNYTNIVEINRSMEAAKRLRQRLDAWRSASEQWVIATLELAGELWTARQMHPNDQAFGHWLVENELDDLSKDDRAALINIGHHPGISRPILEETDRRSPRLIWTELIRPRLLSHHCETAPTMTPSVETPKNDPPGAESEEVLPENEPKEVQGAPEPPVKATVPRNSPFRKLPRADEVMAIYLDPNARATIGKAIKAHGGRQIWDLILQFIDVGFLSPTENTFGSMTLRVLFPHASRAYSNRFDLTKPKDRAKIRDTVLPAAIASRDALLQNPEQLESIVAKYVADQNAVLRAHQTAQRIEKQLSALPAEQQEIVMYGERLWPRPENELYEYVELRSAIWCFRDLNRWLEGSRDPSIASRALMIRYIAGHYHAFARHELEGAGRAKIENLSGVIRKLSRLLERNPEAECKFPPPPKREDEW